jgi:cyclase
VEILISKRIIPCLLLDNERIVKTMKFARPSYVGDPINAVKIFNEKEVDELIIININREGSNQPKMIEYLSGVVSEAFMPITYGGFVDSLEFAAKLYRIGIEKILVRRLALGNPNVVNSISTMFGAQAVSICLDVKKDWRGRYLAGAYGSSGKQMVDLQEALVAIKRLDFGELVINNVDRDGTLTGLDHNLISLVARNTSVPLLAMGGTNSLTDIRNAFVNGADAVVAGAFFVYSGVHKAVLLSYPTQDEINGILFNQSNGNKKI